MSYEDFTEMPVWRMAFGLILEIYKVTKGFPSDERLGLISDMRRAANSIAHNIAEGFGRYEAKDKTRFYKVARGSAYEVMSQVHVSHGLAYIDQATSDKLIGPCKQVIGDLNAIIKTLENRRG
jgi:four helix bundle protein